jgi:hypothetical protein
MSRREYKTLRTKAKMPTAYKRRLKKPVLKEIPARKRTFNNRKFNIIKPKFIETSLNDEKILEEEIDRNEK